MDAATTESGLPSNPSQLSSRLGDIVENAFVNLLTKHGLTVRAGTLWKWEKPGWREFSEHLPWWRVLQELARSRQENKSIEDLQQILTSKDASDIPGWWMQQLQDWVIGGGEKLPRGPMRDVREIDVIVERQVCPNKELPVVVVRECAPGCPPTTLASLLPELCERGCIIEVTTKSARSATQEKQAQMEHVKSVAAHLDIPVYLFVNDQDKEIPAERLNQGYQVVWFDRRAVLNFEERLQRVQKEQALQREEQALQREEQALQREEQALQREEQERMLKEQERMLKEQERMLKEETLQRAEQERMQREEAQQQVRELQERLRQSQGAQLHEERMEQQERAVSLQQQSEWEGSWWAAAAPQRWNRDGSWNTWNWRAAAETSWR